MKLRLVSKIERFRARIADGGLLFEGYLVSDCFPLACQVAIGAASRAAYALVALI